MKHRLPRLLVAASLALGLLTVPTVSSAAEGSDSAPTTAKEVVSAMQPGWNLGNSLDSLCCGADETTWGNPRIDAGLFQAIKKQGFHSVRIPVSWGNHTGPAPDYLIDPAVMARVKEVVGMALDAGLYVMINVHHDSWQWVKDLPTKHDAVMAQYTATWTQIADTFKDSSTKLVFEPINEQSFEGSSGPDADHRYMAELNDTFHRVVRSSGGNNADRLLVLPTLHTGADQADMDALAADISGLSDPMLAATTHNYGFWPFSTNIAGYTTYNAEVQKSLEANFQSQVDTFVSHGIPVIIGEFGLMDNYQTNVERGEYLKFFEDFGYLARTSGITTMWWDNGTLFDRFTRTWRDQEQFDYISTGWTTRSATASSDLVFVDATKKLNDASVTLNLNGLTFAQLRYGAGALKQGKDYALDGSSLTLKKSLLKRILGDRMPGATAQLQIGFSAGMPWKLNVISSAASVLSAASGTTDASVVIPTAFNGDRLATMEAVYADGKNAGPADWTSYKAFSESFAPNYQDGTIQLTAQFLAAIDENRPVTLKFHFWSGQIVQYTITRTGTTVTGVAS